MLSQETKALSSVRTHTIVSIFNTAQQPFPVLDLEFLLCATSLLKTGAAFSFTLW